MKNKLKQHFENQGWEITQNGYLKPNGDMLKRLGLPHMKSFNKLLNGELKIDGQQLMAISKEFNIPAEEILD